MIPSPENGHLTYTLSPGGRVCYVRNACGRRVTYTLSYLGRMIEVTLLLASVAAGLLACGVVRSRAVRAGGVD